MQLDVELFKSAARIVKTEDGKNLIEYLNCCINDNYKSLVFCESTARDIFAGKARAFEEIKDFIINAEDILRKNESTPDANWCA